MHSKKMFKVISPVDKGNGTKWWMRCGTAFVNTDESINVYLDALPLVPSPKGVTLQLREYSADELRERSERKSSGGYAMRAPNGLPLPGGFGGPGGGGGAANESLDGVPF